MKANSLGVSFIIFVACTKTSDPVAVDNSFLIHTWKVFAISETGTWQNASDNNYNSIFTFSKEGGLSITLDVNICGGNYKVEPNNKIAMDWWGCTKKCCDADYGKTITSLLWEINNYSLNRDTLILIGRANMRIALVKQ